MFEEINEDEYYKPILTRNSYNNGYQGYESRGDKNKSLTLEEYLDVIKPHLRELIDNHKFDESGSREWKIQLNVIIKNVSLEDETDVRPIYVWSDNEEIRIGNETDDIINALIDSTLKKYQEEQQVLREKINLVFDHVSLLHYKISKTNLKRGRSYIKSPEWLANKKAIINPKNTLCSCCFAYSIVVALNHQKIKCHPERIRNIAPYIHDYNWEGIDFPAGIKDWKKFEKNNETIALNILQVPHNGKT